MEFGSNKSLIKRKSEKPSSDTPKKKKVSFSKLEEIDPIAKDTKTNAADDQFLLVSRCLEKSTDSKKCLFHFVDKEREAMNLIAQISDKIIVPVKRKTIVLVHPCSFQTWKSFLEHHPSTLIVMDYNSFHDNVWRKEKDLKTIVDSLVVISQPDAFVNFRFDKMKSKSMKMIQRMKNKCRYLWLMFGNIWEIEPADVSKVLFSLTYDFSKQSTKTTHSKPKDEKEEPIDKIDYDTLSQQWAASISSMLPEFSKIQKAISSELKKYTSMQHSMEIALRIAKSMYHDIDDKMQKVKSSKLASLLSMLKSQSCCILFESMEPFSGDKSNYTGKGVDFLEKQILSFMTNEEQDHALTKLTKQEKTTSMMKKWKDISVGMQNGVWINNKKMDKLCEMLEAESKKTIVYSSNIVALENLQNYLSQYAEKKMLIIQPSTNLPDMSCRMNEFNDGKISLLGISEISNFGLELKHVKRFILLEEPTVHNLEQKMIANIYRYRFFTKKDFDEGKVGAVDFETVKLHYNSDPPMTHDFEQSFVNICSFVQYFIFWRLIFDMRTRSK